ncbi:MAG: GNAT family N-acetyltransferase [Eubacterium sp.]|nr:GNAT family N-acetyltransferase [Eubacterium sp.]
MTKEEQRRLVEEQFAIDYNCSVEDFQNKETLVTVKKKQEGARKFEEESFLSILSYHGKLVINAAEEILPWCENVLQKRISAEWCFEAGSLISIDKKLNEFGYGIDQVHLFFLPKYETEVSNAKMRWLEAADIPELEEDERIDEAFLFEDYIEDVLGVEILSDEDEIKAVAGATANSERMWELGVNSFEEGKGYGQAALGALVKEVQRRGKVPYCGTALSHCASQNISLRAGFVPAFCELRSVKIECE